MDEDWFKRFLRLMSTGNEKELVILKGHLLLEEMLTNMLKKELDESNPLNITLTDRSMFSQKSNLAWALFRNNVKAETWVWLKELNSIRNKMAHKPEVADFQKKNRCFH